LLPAPPQIFHGRETEISHIVSILHQDQEPAHLAILGPGGMGKTSLATSALHHPDVVSKYKHRHFISCESATTDRQLIDVVGTHLGLEPARKLSQAIVEHFLKSGPTLLLLDNFETPWEDCKRRNEVEEFLSLLTDVPHLALLVCLAATSNSFPVLILY
jgi:Cdc6-like AAA superfamily ATPase